MTYEQISYDVSDGVATVTLDRPEKLNAFNTVRPADTRSTRRRFSR